MWIASTCVSAMNSDVHGVMLKHFHRTAQNLSVSNGCVEPNPAPASLCADDFEIQKCGVTIDASFDDLISVDIFEQENPRLLKGSGRAQSHSSLEPRLL